MTVGTRRTSLQLNLELSFEITICDLKDPTRTLRSVKDNTKHGNRLV